MKKRKFQIQANFDTILHELTLTTSEEWASRVGIVSFNDNATVIMDLRTYSDHSTIETKLFSIKASTTVDGVNILSGLQVAADLIKRVNASSNRRSVVILFTSAYK